MRNLSTEVARLPVSFEHLYESWFDDVQRWARALGVRESDCDDLTQEVFLIVHRRLPAFDGGNVAGWLFQITRRKVRDYSRLTWISHLFRVSRPVPALPPGAASESPLDELETRRRSKVVSERLSQLSAEQRAALMMFEVEGLKGKEIAQLQGVGLNTVWARIHSARRKLQGVALG